MDTWINFTLINTQPQLLLAAEQWMKEKNLAIDLECENNLHHYGVYISLIQVSSPNKNWIVDVLALGQIAPLIQMLEDKKIHKIFHDISFDFRVLQEQYHCKPKNVVDTQLAALLLGKEHLGLGSLLEEYFGVQKDSKFQRFDWTKRPLPTRMLQYAAKDTAYLLPLEKKLLSFLEEKDRISWLQQEMHFLEEKDFPLTEQEYLDISHVKQLTPQQRGIFHALFEQRKKLAQQVDKPVYKVINNKQLLEVVQKNPGSLETWQRMTRVHPFIRRQAQLLAKICQNAPSEEYATPSHKKLSVKQAERKQELLEQRTLLGEKLGIKPHLLISNEQIIDAVTSGNSNALRPWQRELLFGK